MKHTPIHVTCRYGTFNLVWYSHCGYLIFDAADPKTPVGGLTEAEVDGATMQQLIALVEKSQSQENPLLR